jgi:hypothetical protein
MSTYNTISNPDNWKIVNVYNINNNNNNVINLTGNNTHTTLLKRIVYHRIGNKWLEWFEIKRSTIRNAGFGLFALRTFKADSLLGKYDGVVLNGPPTNQNVKSYTLQIGNRYINGRQGRLGYVHMANDARNNKRNKCYFTVGGYLKVRNDKVIRKNNEIFVYYGTGYWSN